MASHVEVTDELRVWYDSLDEDIQDRVTASIDLLEERGPHLGHPHTTAIVGSKVRHLRELRISALGRPIRILYAYDPLRNAILLLGGDKGGDDRWYERYVPMAERLYDEHLMELKKEGKI